MFFSFSKEIFISNEVLCFGDTEALGISVLYKQKRTVKIPTEYRMKSCSLCPFGKKFDRMRNRIKILYA